MTASLFTLRLSQLLEVNLGALDVLYLNGGATALFTSASQRESSRNMQEVMVVVAVLLLLLMLLLLLLM